MTTTAKQVEQKQLSRCNRYILFLDVVGYSHLGPNEIHSFQNFLLPDLGDLLEKFQAQDPNTWGDAIVAFFEDGNAAIRCALGLRDLFRTFDPVSKNLPSTISCRIALHLSDVFHGYDPVRKQEGYIGPGINLAARIEPVATPGNVWCTRSVVETCGSNNRVSFDPLGSFDLPKNWGKEELFSIRWSHESMASSDRTAKSLFEMPTELASQYRMGNVLHSGSASQVVLVRRRDDQQQFVLKRSERDSPHLQEESLRWTSNMAKCALIAYPLLTFVSNGAKYEMRHYYRGWTLGQILRANDKPIRGDLYRFWTMQMLSLLIPLQSSLPPIVHRDIHPDNYLVQEDDLSLVLLDITYSLPEQRERLPTNRIVAPIGFSSKAQIDGEVCTANDIYSVGAIMHFLSTRKTPLPDEETIWLHAQRILDSSSRSDFDWCWLLLDTRPATRIRSAENALSQLYVNQTAWDHYHGDLSLPDGSKIKMYELKFVRSE